MCIIIRKQRLVEIVFVLNTRFQVFSTTKCDTRLIMKPKIHLSPQEGLQINRSLIEGEVEELFDHIIEYLKKNNLKVPEHVLRLIENSDLTSSEN